MGYSAPPVNRAWLSPAPDYVPAGVLRGRIRDPQTVLRLHQRIEAHWMSGNEGRQLISRAVLLELFCVLFAHPSRPDSPASRTQALLHKLQQRLHELSDAPLSATPSIRQELPKLGYSYGHLLKLFKAHFGMTPGDYIAAIRTERAKRRLRDTDLTVAQVGYELGFENTPYFTRFFRRGTGMSPGEFRRRG